MRGVQQVDPSPGVGTPKGDLLLRSIDAWRYRLHLVRGPQLRAEPVAIGGAPKDHELVLCAELAGQSREQLG